MSWVRWAFFGLVLSLSAALAQTTGPFLAGSVLTSAALNAEFATKMDYPAAWFSPYTPAATSTAVILTDSATVTPDLSAGLYLAWIVGAVGRTLANPTNQAANLNGQRFRLYFVQDSAGNRTITSWGTSYKFPAGVKPTLSTAANAVDEMDCYIRSTVSLDCIFTADFK